MSGHFAIKHRLHLYELVEEDTERGNVIAKVEYAADPAAQEDATADGAAQGDATANDDLEEIYELSKVGLEDRARLRATVPRRR